MLGLLPLTLLNQGGLEKTSRLKKEDDVHRLRHDTADKSTLRERGDETLSNDSYASVWSQPFSDEFTKLSAPLLSIPNFKTIKHRCSLKTARFAAHGLFPGERNAHN